jgi:DNA-binding XRE family transcriptional regulator
MVREKEMMEMTNGVDEPKVSQKSPKEKSASEMQGDISAQDKASNRSSSISKKDDPTDPPASLQNQEANAKNQEEPKKSGGKPPRLSNNLREFRIEQMMSKAELARKAGLSVLTIDRIEKGFGCRMDTKRKILKALGLKLSDRRKLFLEE